MQIDHLWQEILPENVYFSTGNFDEDFLPLTNIEKNSIEVVGAKRMKELEAGRNHARRALKKLNIDEVDIPKDQQTGEPIWPLSIVGSITHSQDLSNSHVAVAVAKKQKIRLLGIDAELNDVIHPSVWPLFLTKDELMWVNAQSPKEKPLLVRKIWSLKEAAIKASGMVDMLSWRVVCQQSQTDNEAYDLILLNDKLNHIKQAKLSGHAICFRNITLAVAYAY